MCHTVGYHVGCAAITVSQLTMASGQSVLLIPFGDAWWGDEHLMDPLGKSIDRIIINDYSHVSVSNIDIRLNVIIYFT